MTSTAFVYSTIFNNPDGFGVPGSEFTPVNWVLLATLSGIIGLVLSGFTIWHLALAASGMTTIESLEKVRYSNPGLNAQQNPFAHPGNGAGWSSEEANNPFSNPFNGISDWSAGAERQRANAAYSSYIDEEALATLPHAFDLGKRQNLIDIFGERQWAWFLPVRMSREEEERMDGWKWETSIVWREGVERVRREREERTGSTEQWPGTGLPPWADEAFENRYVAQPPPPPQRLVARSAGETHVGLVKPCLNGSIQAASLGRPTPAICPPNPIGDRLDRIESAANPW